MKRELTLAQHLAVGFLVVLGIMAAQLVVALLWQQKVWELGRQRDELVLPRSEAARDLRIAILRMAIEVRSYALTADPHHVTAFRASGKQVDELLVKLERMPHDLESRAALEGLSTAARKYAAQADEYVRASAVVPDRERHSALDKALAEQREALLARADGYVALQQRSAAMLLHSARDTEHEQMTVLVAFGLLALAGAGLSAVFTTRRIRRPVAALLDATRALQKGDFEPAKRLGPSSVEGPQVNEIAIVSRAFGDMARELEARSRTMRAEAELSSGIASTLELEQLADVALRKLVEHTRAQLGAVYVRDPGTDKMRRVASFALGGAPSECLVGQGIPGQAAATGEPVLVDEIEESAGFHVQFGFDRVAPSWVLAEPVRFLTGPGGVVVMGGLHPLTEQAREFVHRSAGLLGVSLQNALSHHRVTALAAELAVKAEQLTMKNEELQAQSEELQAQSEELQAQSEELQSQNEEIQSQGEELKAQGEELQAHNELLIANAQRLAEADKRKDEFIAMLAHELRNPLSAMTNAVHVLHKLDVSNASFSRAREVLDRQARHQKRLLDDLLDTSRVARGKIDLRRDVLDLSNLVSEAVEDTRMEFQDRTVRVHLPAGPVWIEGDSDRLLQVMSNLLSNARKFTRAGDRVEVRLTQDPARSAAMVSVCDSGIGVDPKTLPRIFEAFTQSDGGLDRSQGGLGLGLALVQGLISLHGGSVTARSDGLGKGCEVFFTLPLARAPAGRSAGHKPEAAATAALQRTILLIEDNEDAASTLRDLLALLGHKVSVASSGPAGLEVAKTILPDIVLCDLGLPGMDGFEVARLLRQDSSARGMKLIALSGYGEEGTRSKDAGFDRHLTKPVDFDDLQALLGD